MTNLRLTDYLNLIRHLRIDVYFFLSVFGNNLPGVTFNQIIQDKLCLHTYGANETVCFNLENVEPDFVTTRDHILGQATTIKMYMTIITTVPGLVLSFFLGYWIDAYPDQIRYILALGTVGGVFQQLVAIYQAIHFETAPMSLLYSCIGPAISGNLVVAMIGVYTYATRKTKAKYRTLRFSILELFLFAAYPTSGATGGALIAMKPWFEGQYRNYIGVYILSAVCSGAATTWAFVMINDADQCEPDETRCIETIDSIGSTSKDVSPSDSEKGTVEGGQNEKVKKGTMLCDIINFRNVLTTLQTTFKRRENHGRAYLLLTMTSMTLCMMGYMGEHAIGFQFAQKVYAWDATYYSYMSAILTILPIIATIVTPPLVIHLFGLHDTMIGILGSASLSLTMFIKGLILSETGLYISTFFGAFVSLSAIANRSMISRIIEFNEFGQIYALISSIETASPLISSILYSQIFGYTISINPGAAYITFGSLALFPFAVMTLMNFTKNSWDRVRRAERAADVLAASCFDETSKLELAKRGIENPDRSAFDCNENVNHH